MRQVGWLGAISSPIAWASRVGGFLVADLRWCITITRFREMSWLERVTVVRRTGLWRSVVGRAQRRSRRSLAGDQAAVLGCWWLERRGWLSRLHLHVESRAGGGGGRRVRCWDRLRLQGADWCHRDWRWQQAGLGGRFLGGSQRRLVGNDHALVPGHWGGHRRSRHWRAARNPRALLSPRLVR